MWADNETTEDFLNYQIHCDLIKEYVTSPNLLPLTIGVFGDWGSGKSSIMRMLEKKLRDDDKVLTIYFNSWLFEGYEDAKVSLLENILLELSKKENLSEVGKKKLLELLSRVDYMKLTSDGIKKYGKNIVDIITTGGIGTAIEAGFSMLNTDKLKELSTANMSKLDEYIKEEQENKTKSTIKTFRRDFEELIKATDYDSVVIFVDDLDRCMPERVIDTLEAIKLFLSVPNTAFVIGADERIIKHSISMHLQLHTFNNNSDYLQNTQQIVTDYIEKLIQIPYRIPKLSPSEIESYSNLLFCSNLLSKEEVEEVYENYLIFRKENFYSPYNYGNIKGVVKLDSKIELGNLINLSHFMSQMITNILKGNPRQTKRFLNTFILRIKLAKVANLTINEFILIKLMLLEYYDTKLFKKLNDLQSSNDGFIKEIKLLESVYVDGKENTISDDFKEWQTEQIQKWIKIEPRIGEEDLRDYFWLVRDKTESTLSNSHMLSQHIQKIFKGLISENKSVQRVNIEETKRLDAEDLNELINQFSKNISYIDDIKQLLKSLFELVLDLNTFVLYQKLLEIIKSIPYGKIQSYAFVADRLETIKMNEKNLSKEVNTLLENYTKQEKGKLKIASLQSINKEK
ncbi:MAG: P-loop NTPase fold protein [Sulfurimonas sp.]|nr:P-loop NTPase fold protein [Sulfurimonas sp.]MDD5201921.1 P-loop NTPase fold protein [Sulfurimonas sp.]